MKLKINYDLIKKVKDSKKGFSLQKVAKVRVAILPLHLLVLLFYSIGGNFRDAVTGFILGQVHFTLTTTFFIKYLKNIIEKYANVNLQTLALNLNDLGLKTTPELLKESEVIETNYKFRYIDDKLPVLTEEKYIMVPLVNNNEEILLQEHRVGSKNYELSVNGPVLKLKPKVALWFIYSKKIW